MTVAPRRWLGRACIALGLGLGLSACGSNGSNGSSAGGASGAGGSAGTGGVDGGAGSGGSASGGTAGAAGTAGSGATGDAGPDAAGAAGQGGGGGAPADTLDENRDRLLATYLEYLKQNPSQTQSNGLSGSNVSSVCELWQKLDPSSQATFLTLTARMQGSALGVDGSSMLSHVTRLYRAVGGDGAAANDPGSCGGGENNRMIMSMDAELHDAQLAANQHQGAKQANGKYDIADIPASSFWRDSHDVAGPHSPFDKSDETRSGAPRGQTQYFADPSSSAANAPLGRKDLSTLVDPYALEMDQDYNCIHDSNPLCSYTFYGAGCLPDTTRTGADIYTQNYGSYGPGYSPCP